MIKKSILYTSIVLLCLGITGGVQTFSADEWTNSEPTYIKLRPVDINTFNEYRYKITEQYFNLREKFNIDGVLDRKVLENIAILADKGYKYLPDNLTNKNLYNNLLTEIKKWAKYPDNESSYTAIVKAIESYLESTKIDAVKGTIEASPKSGNAPLTVTLRAKVTDPTGTKIPDYNYIWWIDNGGRREIIGRKISINYIIRDEGKTTIFLDVVSNHKNESGYTDVLPFSSRTEIEVKEKVASMIVKVNGEDLRNREEIKFNPDESGYGLIFDATSSTPTSGTKFISTKWNFGNGVKREYDGGPKIERITYRTEGEFTVTLELKTNELKSIERKFKVIIRKPIASINVQSEEGFIGDKFTFKAKPAGTSKDLSYSWEILDIENDKSILKKEGSTITQTFVQKGKYNVKLHVMDPSGEDDLDSKIIYINSRPPVAEFSYTIPKTHKPNSVRLDASRSHDPDFTDDGKLVFNWIIDGEKVNLENPSSNGSVGFYTFDSTGDHSIALEVVDPDGISSVKQDKVSVKSILALDFAAYPRVIQRDQFIRFVGESKDADFFEWDFGDGDKEGGREEKISHVFKKSGMFDVKLTVRDKEGTTNAYSQKVYVGDSLSPVALMNLSKGTNETPPIEENGCSWNPAYIVDRVETIKFDAAESIDIDGDTNGLEYSWKIGNDKFSTSRNLTHKFDELGCFPIKLNVTSTKNGKMSSSSGYVKVKNLPPELTSLQVSIADPSTDPVVVSVTAIGAKDLDGVVQGYLWYYYTDTDNEPQDFRSTTKNSTTFVLPKITGNYFFVLVMKDNNEARVTSDEITDSRFSLTLSGDNVNTPLIDLNVNDSSVSIGDDVVFTANVKNILGKDISGESQFFWDFDGDGFYDKETKENIAPYKYTKSWEFYAKVKVKHKGFSNVRNTPINVSNKLVADFDYISIGNKIIFINKSSGKIEKITWDLWDGKIVEGKENLEHTYSDKKNTHTVKLKIVEGTTTKLIEKKVIANPANILKSKKSGLVLFTSPEYNDKWQIVLDNENATVHYYLKSISGDIKKYVVDYDVEFDTDVNGGKDDDEDNANTPSMSSGDVGQIILNKNKEQKVRFVIKGTTGDVIDSFDITLVKNYVKDESVDIGNISFEGVSEQEKKMLEDLKKLVSGLPAEYKQEGARYVQKLQEEYSDAAEKTKIIIDFEWFLDNENIKNSAEIIALLEQILVYGENDKSEKGVAYSALKNLIPDTITCSVSGSTTQSCKQYLVSKLDDIKGSSDVEKNKKIGTEILSVIGNTESMSSKEKLDFKAVLKTFVYGWLSNIPASEKDEIEKETTDTGESTSGGIMGVLIYVLYGIIWIFGVLLLGALWFWIFYKMSNNDSNVSFKDFIAQKTNGEKAETLSNDVLQEVTPKVQETTPVDPLAAPATSAKPEDTNVPDWLKGAQDATAIPQSPSPETPTQAAPVEQPVVEETQKVEVPDWLKWASETPVVQAEEPKIIGETTAEVPPAPAQTSPEELVVPDWLKGTTVDAPVEKEANIIPNPLDLSEPTAPKTEVPADTKEMTSDDLIIPETKVEELEVPDWLKGSFDTEKKVEETPVVTDTPVETPTEKAEPKKAPAKKPSSKAPKKEETKEKIEPKKTPAKKADKKEESTSPIKDELWQDGMQIPDWLKDASSGDATPPKK